MDGGQLHAIGLGVSPGSALGLGLADAIGPGPAHALELGVEGLVVNAAAAGLAMAVADRGDRGGEDDALDARVVGHAQDALGALDGGADDDLGVFGLVAA